MGDYLDLDVYIDGSAFKNPGHGGGLATIANFSDHRESRAIFRETYKNITNNRMELLAGLFFIISLASTFPYPMAALDLHRTEREGLW